MAVLLFGILPACRGSEEKSRAAEARGSAIDTRAVEVREPVPSSSPASAASGLCLELVVPRARVARGEPVVLIASLRNCSSTERSVTDVLAPEYGFLTVLVTRPSEKGETRWEPGVVKEGRGRRTRTLAPGERVNAWIPVYVDRRGWFLREPGTYRVRAMLALGATRIESDAVSFQVVSGPGATDERAAEILMSPAAARALAQGAVPGSEGWSNLSALLKEYPDSRLAPYAQLAMGISRTQTVFDPETKSFKKPDCPRAVEDLRTALRRLEDPLFAARGTIALSECLEALGQKEATREAVSDYYRLHPQARGLPGIPEMLDARLSRGD